MKPLDLSLIGKYIRRQADRYHRTTLQGIKRIHTVNNSVPATARITQVLHRRNQNRFRERQREISQNNRRFHRKLTRINQVRQSLPPKSPQLPNTLNLSWRKLEAQRIHAENEALLRRLTKMKPTLDTRKQLQDFQRNSKYKNLISNPQLTIDKKFVSVRRKETALNLEKILGESQNLGKVGLEQGKIDEVTDSEKSVAGSAHSEIRECSSHEHFN